MLVRPEVVDDSRGHASDRSVPSSEESGAAALREERIAYFAPAWATEEACDWLILFL